jgi:hypothetical protein
MSIQYHGNWCGPGWSNGEYQPSKRGHAPPIDEFDTTCQDHDYAYADGMDVNAADDSFYDANIGRGVKRSIAAVLVKAQSLIRPSTNKTNVEMSRMRGSKVRPVSYPLVPSPPKTANKRGQRPQPRVPKDSSMVTTLAPVSIGTSIKSSIPRQTHTRSGCRITGREFMGSVYESNSSNWQMSALCPLHPAYFPGSTISNVARGFTKYRWRSLTVHFVTRQPTSVTGEIALAYSANCLMPAEDGSSSTFLPRVMTRGNAVLGPLWTSHSIRIPCDNKSRLVDAFSSVDFNENVLGELQVYTLSGVSDTAGYLLFDYDLDYSEIMYQPHSTYIPITTGGGASYTLTDSSATPTASNSVQLTNAAITGAPNGTVFRAILDWDQSTASTGTTAANAWEVNTAYASSLTAISSVASNFTLRDGQQVYLGIVGTSLYAYGSLDSALSGDATGQLFYRTTGSSAGSYVVIAYLVRFGPGILQQTQ